ncbi:hypothetical protein AK812_SmicGene3849 [Symbiodinium microadriaticum]|uniref:Uncharacterized protein n=1 Tax=Symbiodinium microadriaticum TaxID=2951 RepID=A0A1Q9EXX5_SYMMI|nr:hypothetical protein AK812_SmicGene3849 [Symbiodinium microadriaticum]
MSDHRAEDLTFEQMKIAVTPLVCRALPQPVSLQLPLGIYNPLILPITLLQIHDNPLVNMFDVISNHSRDIDFAQLEKAFVDANSISNFSQLPEPFGFKGELPKGTKMQIFIYPRRDGGHHIIKHFVCTLKCKPKIFNSGVYGQAYVYNWRSTDAKVGKKIIQYTLENLGGRQYKIFDLVSYNHHFDACLSTTTSYIASLLSPDAHVLPHRAVFRPLTRRIPDKVGSGPKLLGLAILASACAAGLESSSKGKSEASAASEGDEALANLRRDGAKRDPSPLEEFNKAVKAHLLAKGQQQSEQCMLGENLYLLIKVKSECSWQPVVQDALKEMRSSAKNRYEEVSLMTRQDMTKCMSGMTDEYALREAIQLPRTRESTLVRVPEGAQLLPAQSMRGQDLTSPSALRALQDMVLPIKLVFAWKKEAGRLAKKIFNDVQALLHEVEKNQDAFTTAEGDLPGRPRTSLAYLKYSQGRGQDDDALTPREDEIDLEDSHAAVGTRSIDSQELQSRESNLGELEAAMSREWAAVGRQKRIERNRILAEQDSVSEPCRTRVPETRAPPRPKASLFSVLLDTLPSSTVSLASLVDRNRSSSAPCAAQRRAPRPAPDFRQTEDWRRANEVRQRRGRESVEQSQKKLERKPGLRVPSRSSSRQTPVSEVLDPKCHLAGMHGIVEGL